MSELLHAMSLALLELIAVHYARAAPGGSELKRLGTAARQLRNAVDEAFPHGGRGMNDSMDCQTRTPCGNDACVCLECADRVKQAALKSEREAREKAERQLAAWIETKRTLKDEHFKARQRVAELERERQLVITGGHDMVIDEQRAAARTEALEEAAVVADNSMTNDCGHIAAAIRAKKGASDG